ncbi:MAG: glutamine--fructose-6-phosphate transaminase (isomerizing), partial [Acidimicrobiia bacterium]|nr:glutamine--fructose-6-phosphate transaminase (isomerizing) [Acidimicrobiia bacterium]
RSPVDVEWDVEAAEKGGFDHFMLKEIHEQPEVVAETLMGRIDGDHVDLNEVGYTDEFAIDLRKIWITACGTAYHAGLVGKQLFEGLLRIPTEVVYAHELRYSDPLIEPGDLVIAISQSGETVDTLVAARLAKQLGARLVAITNVPGSALSHEADDTIYTRAGIEISVASTKAYVAMVVVQYLLAMDLGQRRKTLSAEDQRRLGSGLAQLPGALETIIGHDDAIARVAETLVDAQDIYFIGRGLDYAVVMEGSLKLKEISYIHSEAMPAGELKHGTLALVTEGTPVVVVLTQEATYDKTISAVQEVKARGAYVIGIGYEDDDQLDRYVDEVIRIPRVEDLYAPVPAAVPLQLLAYHVARLRGLDIDQPRNLAKSVTVE